MVEHELSTREVATRLGISAPTVRSLLRAGELSGRTVELGGRFAWRISAKSVDAYVTNRDGRGGNRRRVTVTQLGEQLDELRLELRSLSAPAGHGTEEALRVEVATLRDTVLRQRAIADASNAADRARGEVVQHLLAALAASEVADERRREATALAENIVGQFLLPGNADELGDPELRAERAHRSQP